MKNYISQFGSYCTLVSQALAVVAWAMSFFFVIKIFGALGIFFIFLFQLLIPVAVIVAMLQGAWSMAGQLLFCLGAMYVIRFLGRASFKMNAPVEKRSTVIDVEIEETSR